MQVSPRQMKREIINRMVIIRYSLSVHWKFINVILSSLKFIGKAQANVTSRCKVIKCFVNPVPLFKINLAIKFSHHIVCCFHSHSFIDEN